MLTSLWYDDAEKAGPQKRPVAGPRKAFTLQNAKLETITPIPYDILKVQARQLLF